MNSVQATLSLELQAAQLLMPSLHPARYARDEEYRQQISALIEGGVGGFCVFQGTMEEAAHAIAEAQAQADVPLLISADYEHGLPMRLDGGTDFPHAMALGVGHDPHITRQVASAVAREAAALGVHWNFAPVCDINSNKQNPIINTRAFGESIGDVIPHTSAWIEASQEHKVAACAKHFPGHGDCSTDSHLEVPVLTHSRQRLTSVELVPFLAAIRQGVRSVMMSHLSVPSFDPSGLPASLSHAIVSGVLREYMKYDGIIVSDALDMHAISKTYASADAVLRCIAAGVDIALIPEDPASALMELKAAALNASLSELRIRESCARVIELKEWCGLFEKKSHKAEAISLEEHGMLALKAAINAVRVQGDQSVLPLEQYEHIACFALLSNDDMDPASEFFHFLSQVYEKDTDIGYVNALISDQEVQAYKEQTALAECVVFAVFARARSYAGTVALDDRLLQVARELADSRPAVAILFGNPYIADDFPASTIVQCYSDSKPSRGAACLALSKKSLSL